MSSYAYELDLPPEMKVHPTFHVSLLQPVKHEPFARQAPPPPPPMIVDNGNGQYFVDSIDDMQWNKRSKGFELLVKWEGYEKPTWEPYDQIKADAPALVKEFHEDHPSRPAPSGWLRQEGKRMPSNTRNKRIRK